MCPLWPLSEADDQRDLAPARGGDRVEGTQSKGGSMTRSKAIERVRKLREMTVARGATENEAAVAKAKTDELIARFELRPEEIAPRTPPSRPAFPMQPAWGVSSVFQQTSASITTANVWIQFA
jgi:hypothetical protein